MNKKILCTVVLLSLTTQLVGCKQKDEESVKRIVLETDVRESNLDLKNVNSKTLGEIINLQLNEGDYFYPAFYYEGEVYGYISKGSGIIKETPETHPIGGFTKQYLYKIRKDNSLIKTSKEAFICATGREAEKLLGFEFKKEDRVFSVNYKKEDKPREIPEITALIKDLKEKSVKNYNIGGDEDYVFIEEWERYGPEIKEYFYDMKNKKLYQWKGERKGALYYIEALQSFIAIGNDSKFYTLKFEDKHCYLEEYIDLKTKENTNDLEGVMLNTDEMLIIQRRYIREVENPYYKVTSISRFNFKTNQYTMLFEPPKEVNMNAEYIKNNILIFEEAEERNKTIVPVKRYLKKINGNELNNLFEQKIGDDDWSILFEEKIEDEGEKRSSRIWTLISEDEKEMFLTKELIGQERGVKTTKDILYKKYKIQ